MEQELTSTDDTLQQPERSGQPLPLQAVETGAISTPLQRSRHKHLLSTALVTRNTSHIKIRSDQLTHRIMLGLLEGKNYTKHPARHLAEYRQALPKGQGSVSIALTPRSEETWDHVLVSLDLLGDELVDTFVVLLAVALDTNEAEHITNPFAITADDILAVCQKKKSKGSYSPRQQQSVHEHIHTLARASVRVTLLGESKQWQVESPLLEMLINAPLQGNETHTRHKDWQPWHLKIGNWIAMEPQMQYQTAMMARQVLQYHAKEQKHEKRLGRYLTIRYCINAHSHKDRVKVSMGMLLAQAGITPYRNHPSRTREAIESALTQLHTDGVIGRFAPLVDHSSHGREIQERIEQRAYHWWDDYQRQLWLFEPPELL